MKTLSTVPEDGRDHIVAPDAVLTPEGIESGWAAAVIDGVFATVGPAAGVRTAHPELPIVHARGRLLMPGFVDAHHHLSQVYGTGHEFGEPSEIFRRVWVPLEHALTEEELRAGAELAALQALRGGFTTVADAGTRSPHGPLPLRSAADLGVRTVLAVTCADDADGALSPDAAVARAAAHVAALEGDPMVTASVGVPISESLGPDALAALAAWTAERGLTLQIHVNEHLAAVERSLEQHGRRPLEYLDDLGVVGPWLLAAHASLLTPEEVGLLRERGAAVSYNPVATYWKGNATAAALWFAALGVRFGLGTDGTRSDGFRLADAAETAQRLASAMGVGDPDAGRGRLWLAAATSGAADAVGLGAVTGRIAPGYAADYLLVDLDVPEHIEPVHPEWELVRRGDRGQIDQVVVAGALRLINGWPPGWDRDAFLARQREHARAAVARAGLGRGR